MRCAIVAWTFPMHVLQQLRNLFPGVPVGTMPRRVNSTQVRRRVGVAQTRLRHLTVRRRVLFVFFVRCVRAAADRVFFETLDLQLLHPYALPLRCTLG